MQITSEYLFFLLHAALFTIVTGCPQKCTCTNSKTTCNRATSLRDIVTKLDSNTDELEIFSTTINSLSATDFEGNTASNLKTLILHNCFINQIYDNAFNDLSQLENLNLSQNSISSISGNAFSRLVHLTILDLSSNGITSLGEEFVPLIQLQYLDLGQNYLTTINAGVFRMNSLLQTLVLHENKLGNLHGDSFKGLTGLKNLILRNCDLTSIPTDLFTNLRIINKLDVGNNRIVVLPQSDFFVQNAQYLRTLLLDGNQLEALAINQFSGMHLDELTLGKNRIRAIPYGAFDHLDVKNLDLSENAINSIHRNAFRQIGAQLSRLNLAGNSLGSVPSESLESLYRLQYLNLSMCHLDHLDTYEFQQLHYLQVLDISKNRIPYIPHPVLDSFNRLSQVTIEQNAWNCDCHIIPFRKWLFTSNVGKMHCSSIHSIECRNPKCSTPPLLAGQQIRLTEEQQLKCEEFDYDHNLTTLQVVGISVGCIVGVAVLVAVIIICIRYLQGKITLTCNDSQISSHDLGEKDRSSRPFHDPDVGSLDESDKSFVVRKFFNSMDADPSAISLGSPDFSQKDLKFSQYSRSYSSLHSVGYNPMGRESAV